MTLVSHRPPNRCFTRGRESFFGTAVVNFRLGAWGGHMDAYLNWLDKVIGAKLAEGAVGKVVFVRAHFQWTADHGVLMPVLDAALDIVGRWVGSRIRKQDVLGS